MNRENLVDVINIITNTPEPEFKFCLMCNCIAGLTYKAHEPTLHAEFATITKVLLAGGSHADCSKRYSQLFESVHIHLANYLGITCTEGDYLIQGYWSHHSADHITKQETLMYLKALWVLAEDHNAFMCCNRKYSHSRNQAALANHYNRRHNLPQIEESPRPDPWYTPASKAASFVSYAQQHVETFALGGLEWSPHEDEPSYTRISLRRPDSNTYYFTVPERELADA